MAYFENTAQGGSQGTTPTVGNTGGDSGDAFYSVGIDSPCVCTFDDTHGAYAYKAVHSVSGGAVSLTFSFGEEKLTCNGRVELYMPAYTAEGVDILTVALVFRWGSGTIRFNLDHDGMLSVTEQGVGTICAFTTALPLNQWCRLEYTFNHTAGTYAVSIFDTAQGTSPSQALSGSHTFSTGGFFSGAAGVDAAVEDITVWYDNLYYGDGTTLPGRWMPTLNVPPAAAEVTGPGLPDPIPNNNLFALKTVVGIPAGDTYTSDETSNLTYDLEVGEDDSYGYRSAWWTYTPYVSGTATFDTQQTVDTGDGVDTVLVVFTGSSLGTLVYVADDDESGTPEHTSILSTAVTGGVTYQIAVYAYYPDEVMGYVLHIDGPTTESAVVLFPTPAEVQAQFPIPTNDFPLYPPPAAATAVSPAPRVVLTVIVPPASATATLPAPSFYSLTRITPSGCVVPSPTPIFLVAFNRDGPGAFLLRVTVTNGVMTPVTATATPLGLAGNIPTPIPITTALADGLYQWQIEFFDGVTWAGPSDTWPITVYAAGGAVTASGTLTVAAGTTTPTLWHVAPAGALVGATATCLGVALPTASAHISLAGTTVPITAYRSVAADADAYTADRQIDVLNGVTDPEHVELDFVVPDLPGPGGALLVVED